MIGHRRLLLLWAGMLLVATLCPGVQSRRGGGIRIGSGSRFKSRSKWGLSAAKSPSSHSRGSSNVGAAAAGAAGAAGGAALGYGLGSMGRHHNGYGHGYGHHHDSSSEGRRFYYANGLGHQNQSDYGGSEASSGPLPSIAMVLGSVVSVVLGNWIRGV